MTISNLIFYLLKSKTVPPSQYVIYRNALVNRNLEPVDILKSQMKKYQISDGEIFCKIVFNELLKFNVHFNIHLIFKPNMPWLVFYVDRHASLMRFFKSK